MISAATPHPDASPSAKLAERVATGCLCAALVCGPVALGGTPPWITLSLEAAMAAAAMLWSLTRPRPLRLTLLPLAVAALACIQILPMPDAVLRAVAPLSAAAWKLAGGSAWGTVSVDPASTATAIRRLLLGLVTVAAVTDLGRHPTLRRWLIETLTVTAIIIWTLGLVFPVDPKERILLGMIDLKGPIMFWRTEIAEPVQTGGTGTYNWVPVGDVQHEMPGWSIGDGFGSYVISNHFAGAMYLTVPIALALWLFLTRDRLPDPARYAACIATAAAATWTVGRLADSRAGGASMLLTSLTLLSLAAEHRLWRRLATGAWAGYVAVLVLFCIAFFGPWTGVQQLLPEGLQQPLRSLRSDGRVVATRIAGQILSESPILGSGLDTFGELQPTYLGNVFLLHYAHNDYVQLLTETGLVGGCIAGVLAALLIARSRRFRREATPPIRCLDAGPWAALAGITLHSAFDWNLHVPANALLAAAVTGLAISTVETRRDASNGLNLARFRRTASNAVAIACAAAVLLLARDAAATSARQLLSAAIVEARKTPDTASPTPVPVLSAALATGERIARWAPADAKLAILIGQAHLHLASHTVGPDGGCAAATAADAWFARARSHCAVCKGLPVPLSRAAQQP